MPTITPETLLKKNDGVFSGVVDDETVAMSVQNGKYYRLNATGSRILALLEEPRSFQDLCETLHQRYGGDGTVLGQDVVEFVNEMVKLGLIETA